MKHARVGSEAHALLSWLALIVIVAARAYRAALLTLMAAALVPMVWGWHNYLVKSGSMQPSLAVGDVVVAAPIPRGAPIPMGRVMVFTSPATGRTMVHRVVAKAKTGGFTTAGDANPRVDPAPVARSAFHAQARLRIPLIGLPVMWLTNGHLVHLISWLLATTAAFFVASIGGRRRAPPKRPHRVGPPETNAASPGERHAPRRRWLRKGVVVAMVVVPATIAVSPESSSAASFTSVTRIAGNNWGAAPVLNQAYTAQILTDNPRFYYRLDEASGSTAVDSSGNARPGTYFAVGQYHQAGALPGDPGYSVALAGSNARLLCEAATAVAASSTFTLELWFKTSSTTGGKLIGFNSTTGSASLTYDRHIFMRTDGRLVYGGWVGGNSLTTSASYNDNKWHYLVVTATPHGSQQQDFAIYVDAALVGSGNTRISSYNGWWQVGFGPLPVGSGYPLNANFIGNIDNVAVYTTALSSARISAHYAAR